MTPAAPDGGSSGEPPSPAAVTGEVSRAIDELVEATGPGPNRDLLRDLLVTSVGLILDDASRLDVKIAAAALREMRQAFRLFAPYRDIPKVTIFGSARTRVTDPAYAQARDLARALAARGWMVVTGAGPGIMAAGLEGAGRDRAFGVNIRLPFEQAANEFVDPSRLVEMKYFFTRKVMLVKESRGYVAMPGGFGTLDETFELLTLLQTSKAPPAPLVLLDPPGDGYWRDFDRFVTGRVLADGYISPEDPGLYRITDRVEDAVEEIIGFYRNFHSIRWVGDLLVIRLRRAPDDDELAELNDRFGHLCARGRIERIEPTPAERSQRDHLDLARVALTLDIHRYAGLRALIDALNRLPSAPATDAVPAEVADSETEQLP